MHFLQSQLWRECKKRLGNPIFEVGEYFFHTTKLPVLGRTVGYMPRPDLKTIDWAQLYHKGEEAGCVYITIDPENLKSENTTLPSDYKISAGEPIHLQLNTLLDLTKSDDELLSLMKQKHRYNLNLAKKKNVEVRISYIDEAFNEFLETYLETIKRQGYHGRNERYVRTIWETLKELTASNSRPSVIIATAYFERKALASWFLFLYEDTIYYPYGGSSEESKNVMAPYLLVWEIIQWGKENGYKHFDLWGIKKSSEQTSQQVGAGEQTQVQYDGYSRFKVGFGGRIVEYADTIDLVIDPLLYGVIKTGANLRSKILFK